MPAILDRLLEALRRFVLLRGSQLTEVAVALAMSGVLAAFLVVAGKLGRSAKMSLDAMTEIGSRAERDVNAFALGSPGEVHGHECC
jgi:hypothetical protein